MTIPGHGASALDKFERMFYDELCNQHDRVDLFVKSKADEFARRLDDFQKRSDKMIGTNGVADPERLSVRKRDKLMKMETRLMRLVFAGDVI